MYIQAKKSTCIVFKHSSLQELLEEIVEYLKTSDRYDLEKTMQDFVIIYDNDQSSYIATIYTVPEL